MGTMLPEKGKGTNIAYSIKTMGLKAKKLSSRKNVKNKFLIFLNLRQNRPGNISDKSKAGHCNRLSLLSHFR